MSIGIELSKKKMVFTDDVVVLNTNKENEFLLTPLFSYGFPLINYKLGDTGENVSSNKISNLYPFPIMDLMIGRTTDKFLTDSNRKISTSSLGSYMAKLDLGIDEHKIIQSNYKEFEIYYKSSSPDDEIYYNKVTTSLNEYFGNDLNIKFKKVSKLPIEKSGKNLMFKRTFNLEV